SVAKPEQIQRFEEFYEKHWLMIEPPEDETLRLGWLFDRMEAAVVRHGADFIVIDPFTEIDLELRSNETERDRINEVLTDFNRFARQYKVHVAVIAHPTKPSSKNEREAPLGYDVSGAAHWKNKPYLGVTVHKDPDVENFAQIHVWKSKRRDPMGPTGMFIMRYDENSSTYKAAVRAEYDALLADSRTGIRGVAK
ncbi:MAG: AAA family ATPase, partial [Pseudomonadota bacterium]